MFFWLAIALFAAGVSARPGYPHYDDFHAPALPLPLSVLPGHAIVKSAPIYEPEPLISHAPIYASAPIYTPAPIYAPAPSYIKAAPIVKTIAPATSYATVTQIHVTHPQIVKVAQPIVKTVVSQPIIKSYVAQPVLKSYALPSPWDPHGHDYYH